MALKFLSKKRFHPRKVCNILKVVEAETVYKEEMSRMSELRREREEERNTQLLTEQMINCGLIPKVKPRVEFLYKAPIIINKEEDDVDPVQEKYEKLPETHKLVDSFGRAVNENKLAGSKFVASVKPSKGDQSLMLMSDPATAIYANKERLTSVK